MGFPRQEYWSRLHFLILGLLSTQGSNPCLLHWQVDSLPLSHQGGPRCYHLHLEGCPSIRPPFCVLSTRDLLQLGGELARTSRAIQEAGLGLSVGLRLAESRAEASLEKQALLEEQLRSKELQEQELARLQLQSNLDKANLSDRWVLEGAVRQASLEHIAGILGQRGVCSPTMVPSPVCAWPVYPGPLFGRGEDRFRGLLPRFSVQPPLPVVKNPSASAGD